MNRNKEDSIVISKEEFEKYKNKYIEELKNTYNFSDERAQCLVVSKLSEISENLSNKDKLVELNKSLRHHLFYYGKIYDVLILGMSKLNDYGKQRRYDESLYMYNTNPEQAIRKRYTNEDGVPLDNKGSEMKLPEQFWERKLYCITFRENKFKEVIITIKGNALNLNYPLGKRILINCYNEFTDKKRYIRLESDEMTEIISVIEPKENIEYYIEKIWDKHSITCKELDDIKEYKNKNIEFFIIKARITTEIVKPGYGDKFYKIKFKPAEENEIFKDDKITDLSRKIQYEGISKDEVGIDGFGYILGNIYEQGGETRYEIFATHIIEPNKDDK